MMVVTFVDTLKVKKFRALVEFEHAGNSGYDSNSTRKQADWVDVIEYNSNAGYFAPIR